MDFISLLLSLLVSQPGGLAVGQVGQDLGTFRNTNYYVVLETDYINDPTDTPILDMKGREIIRVSHRFKAAMDIEGTGKLKDDRVLNYAGRIQGEIRYLFSPHPWGIGVGTCELIPFHSIAVDPEVVPLGATILIAETKGMILPDGSAHDGLWQAEDVGGAIKKDRVDLFIGIRKNNAVLSQAKIENMSPLHMQIVSLASNPSCIHALFTE